MVRVEHVLDSWKLVRRDTAQAVREMPEGDLGFQPSPDVMNFGQMLPFTEEHELTHRSQMFLYLRLTGVIPPTTRRRPARK